MHPSSLPAPPAAATLPGGVARSRLEAQARADRIEAFRTELLGLSEGPCPGAPPELASRWRRWHDEVRADLRERFDVDLAPSERPLTVGARAAAFFGSLSFGAALPFAFYRLYGDLPQGLVVAGLVAMPFLLALASVLVARREPTPHLSTLLGMLAFSAFVLDLTALGRIFGVVPTDAAFLAWALFGLALAYTLGVRTLLASGIVCLIGWMSARTGTYCGVYWLDFGRRPESSLLAGLVVFAVPALVRHRRLPEFAAVYRVLGATAVLLPVLTLSHWGRASYLPISPPVVEGLYELAGFVLSAALVWLGASRGWKDSVYTGGTFFALLLYTKVFDWWWDALPKDLFFLGVGAMALGTVFLLVRARERRTERREDPAT